MANIAKHLTDLNINSGLFHNLSFYGINHIFPDFDLSSREAHFARLAHFPGPDFIDKAEVRRIKAIAARRPGSFFYHTKRHKDRVKPVFSDHPRCPCAIYLFDVTDIHITYF